MRHLIEANYVFVKITEGIYRVRKTKDALYTSGEFVGNDTVLHSLNNTKVAIVDEKDALLYKNFPL